MKENIPESNTTARSVKKPTEVEDEVKPVVQDAVPIKQPSTVLVQEEAATQIIESPKPAPPKLPRLTQVWHKCQDYVKRREYQKAYALMLS